MDPHQVQYIQKMSNHGKDSTRIAGNSSQGLHFVGSHGHDNMQSLEKAYLEALLLQQAQQYQSHILQKPGGVSHQYHGNSGFSPYVASYQGNPLLSSQNPRDSSRHMIQNEKSSTIESLKGETTGSLHLQSGNNTKGKFESLLEMLKNNKTKSLELSDILGHVVEFRYERAAVVVLFHFIDFTCSQCSLCLLLFSTDQFGSRFIQQKLETATVEEKTKILAEIIPNALGLMIDVFGNYVIQKVIFHIKYSSKCINVQ